ncbi:MAG: hypothetical protein ABJK39_00525 [Hyphomicrobiales bacterium]
MYRAMIGLWFFGVSTDNALAHASNQAFVPLLPTGFYTAAGVAAVAVTVLLLAIPSIAKLFSTNATITLFDTKGYDGHVYTSLLSSFFWGFLVIVGFYGSHDPLVNPLPLFIWTVWWVGFVTLSAVIGNFWHWLNPWSGLYELVVGSADRKPPLTLPATLGSWPAIIIFVAFAIFMLASISPEDPEELAFFVLLYLVFTFIGMVLFGKDEWESRAECFTMIIRYFSSLSIIGIHDNKVKIGVPSWKLKTQQNKTTSAGLFVLTVFAISSFDGLNETFWWLDFLDINPLEFPGRSAIFWETTAGVLITPLILISLFCGCVYSGLAIVGETKRFREAFFVLAIAIVPIAVGYHLAHYLASFLVNIQYSLAAATDPWTTGADFLNLGTFYVTTGFFNTLEGSRTIFLTQVTAVVAGHILSIIVAHASAYFLFKNNKIATVSQIPLAVFMIAYTLFGLWLLAAPRGI